ncbi:hypothetical protein BV25DRAFT_1836515 [Artomyces pyxidatus]|uniref:Uncharacterized protein n=1 Tax=Artomyces pyxidatus TaxID=48021 RepID=A0ACB8T8R0_9AGAM|nr:hypothetical protein BV25DRAFT_1836515 [Artomyces pyxidatus]
MCFVSAVVGVGRSSGFRGTLQNGGAPPSALGYSASRVPPRGPRPPRPHQASRRPDDGRTSIRAIDRPRAAPPSDHTAHPLIAPHAHWPAPPRALWRCGPRPPHAVGACVVVDMSRSSSYGPQCVRQRIRRRDASLGLLLCGGHSPIPSPGSLMQLHTGQGQTRSVLRVVHAAPARLSSPVARTISEWPRTDGLPQVGCLSILRLRRLLASDAARESADVKGGVPTASSKEAIVGLKPDFLDGFAHLDRSRKEDALTSIAKTTYVDIDVATTKAAAALPNTPRPRSTEAHQPFPPHERVHASPRACFRFGILCSDWTVPPPARARGCKGVPVFVDSWDSAHVAIQSLSAARRPRRLVRADTSLDQ